MWYNWLMEKQIISTHEYSDKFAELCNVMWRVYADMPLPGDEGDDGIFHTSDRSRQASRLILDILNVHEEEPVVDYGGETDPEVRDQIYWVAKLKMSHGEGHSEDWYVALYQRLRLGMATPMPKN